MGNARSTLPMAHSGVVTRLGKADDASTHISQIGMGGTVRNTRPPLMKLLVCPRLVSLFLCVVGKATATT